MDESPGVVSEGFPESPQDICERINEHYPSKRQSENWSWRVPFSAERVVVPFNMEEEDIVRQLDVQFAELMNFEKDLLQVMNNE